jgi:4-nitrophenyl phosphatase
MRIDKMIKGYIFDMDGVIWDGDKKIPHAVERINEIIASGKKYVFMTNNALRSRETYVKRLKEFGIKTDISHIIIASYAAGLYINEKTGHSKVYVLGTDEMKKELESAGHKVVEKGADFVVVGLDKGLNYDKIDKAFINLQNGAELIACAPDLTYLQNGEIHIGSGAFARALEFATGKELTIIGKPSSVIMKLATDMLGLKSEEILGVGDKIPTDILAAKKAGMKTALVLTGETTLKEAQESEIKPDYVIKDLRELP